MVLSIIAIDYCSRIQAFANPFSLSYFYSIVLLRATFTRIQVNYVWAMLYNVLGTHCTPSPRPIYPFSLSLPHSLLIFSSVTRSRHTCGCGCVFPIWNTHLSHHRWFVYGILVSVCRMFLSPLEGTPKVHRPLSFRVFFTFSVAIVSDYTDSFF